MTFKQKLRYNIIMLNYLNIAIAIYLVISAGLFLYLHHLSEENINNHKKKLWFVLFFYFAVCMFVLQMVVSTSNG